jgi:hypothetical protein
LSTRKQGGSIYFSICITKIWPRFLGTGWASDHNLFGTPIKQQLCNGIVKQTKLVAISQSIAFLGFAVRLYADWNLSDAYSRFNQRQFFKDLRRRHSSSPSLGSTGSGNESLPRSSTSGTNDLVCSVHWFDLMFIFSTDWILKIMSCLNFFQFANWYAAQVLPLPFLFHKFKKPCLMFLTLLNIKCFS